jgi:imidazolonepropionase-like amidohydrolase
VRAKKLHQNLNFGTSARIAETVTLTFDLLIEVYSSNFIESYCAGAMSDDVWWLSVSCIISNKTVLRGPLFVCITGNLISSINNTPPPSSARLIVCGPTSTLLPGFIDVHVHLTIHSDNYQEYHLKHSSADKAIRALRVAKELLHNGVTTIRTAGDADMYYPTMAVRRAIDSGQEIGPRIVGAGYGAFVCF